MNLEKARRAQQLLAEKLRLEPLRRPVNFVGAADFAFDRNAGRIGAALVVMDINTLEIVDEATAVTKSACPYIPGYLCFREGPVFFQAWKRIIRQPEVWFLDGNGLAHPRRMGLASFVGVIADVATIGCAKSAFFRFEMPERSRGSFTIYRNRDNEPVGFCVRTREDVKPVFVSPGHRVSFDDCLWLTLELAHFRLPEPLRLAHGRAKQIFLRP